MYLTYKTNTGHRLLQNRHDLIAVYGQFYMGSIGGRPRLMRKRSPDPSLYKELGFLKEDILL